MLWNSHATLFNLEFQFSVTFLIFFYLLEPDEGTYFIDTHVQGPGSKLVSSKVCYKCLSALHVQNTE